MQTIMKYLKRSIHLLVLLINFIMGYFVATGIHGYRIASSPERQESWFLATVVWVIVIVLVDSIYLSLRLFFWKKGKGQRKLHIR